MHFCAPTNLHCASVSRPRKCDSFLLLCAPCARKSFFPASMYRFKSLFNFFKNKIPREIKQIVVSDICICIFYSIFFFFFILVTYLLFNQPFFSEGKILQNDILIFLCLPSWVYLVPHSLKEEHMARHIVEISLIKHLVRRNWKIIF